MATCDFCNGLIHLRPIWEREDGKPVWSPPMDIFNEERDLRTGEDGLLRMSIKTELVEHRCPQKVEHEREWAEAREAESARQRQLFAQGESYEQLLERAALRDCPRCGVKAGEVCENLQQRKQGIKVLNRNPHHERVQFRG